MKIKIQRQISELRFIRKKMNFINFILFKNVRAVHLLGNR